MIDHDFLQNEETTNLVNIFPNPNLMGPPAGGSDGKFNFGNNYSSNTFSDNLPPPHTYNFGPNSQPPAESDQAGPPGQQHPVNWGGVSHSGNNARFKKYPTNFVRAKTLELACLEKTLKMGAVIECL